MPTIESYAESTRISAPYLGMYAFFGILVTTMAILCGHMAVKPTGDLQFIQGPIVKFSVPRGKRPRFYITVESTQGVQQTVTIPYSLYKELKSNPSPIKLHYFRDSTDWVEIQHRSKTHINSWAHSFNRQAGSRLFMLLGVLMTGTAALCLWPAILNALFPHFFRVFAPFKYMVNSHVPNSPSPDATVVMADAKPRKPRRKRRRRRPARGY